MSEVDDVVAEFLVESGEYLDQLDQDLVALEADPTAQVLIDRIFRAVHTIKGGCGFLQFGRLERVTHTGEELLSAIRDGAVEVTPEINDALLALNDLLRGAFEAMAGTGVEPAGDDSDLIARLSSMLGTVPAADPGSVGVASAAPTERSSAAPSDRARPVVPKRSSRQEMLAARQAAEEAAARQLAAEAAARQAAADAAVLAVGESIASLPSLASALAPSTPAAPAPASAPAAPAGEAGGTERARPTLARRRPKAEIEAEEAAAAAAAAAEAAAAEAAAAATAQVAAEAAAAARAAEPAEKAAVTPVGGGAETTVRVDVAVLDDLMNLVGELVLARNQLMQTAVESGDARGHAQRQRISNITSDLQRGVMKTRLQPISAVWAKLPRVVRDLARGCGKEVVLEMEGSETELDRTLIEAIKDPLTHLVRNAIDHGIETPAERMAAGKLFQGCLKLRAFHDGGKVNITISEDGAGINTDRVKAKAVEKGLITAEEAEKLTLREAQNLVFLPGFSTAATVTNISGRGVGMDVVKTNIERVGGSVDVTSEEGVGTTFTLKIPLTLAIVPALLVSSGGQRYAISQLSLKELLRLDSRQEGVVEWVHGVPLHRLRGRLLPLVDLAAVLGHEPSLVPGRVLSTVVVQVDDHLFGLVVDDVANTQEIVVKPLGKQVGGVTLFAGATILGDGRVALILDVAGVARSTAVLDGAADWTEASATTSASDELVETVSTLLVDVGDGRRAGVPLDAVLRLEEFSPRSLEWIGAREVVQYHGSIMPLVRAGELLGFESPLGHDRAGSVSVLVCGVDDDRVGLVVDGVADIVDVPVEHDETMVLNGRVTELVDLADLIRSFDYAALRR